MFLYVFSPPEYDSELNFFTNLLVQALGTLLTLIVQHCTRFIDAGGRFVAPNNLHPSCYPLVYYMNNIISIEVPKLTMPGVNGGPRSRVISDQHSLRRILTLGGKTVENCNIG